jgi:hypothetical protein
MTLAKTTIALRRVRTVPSHYQIHANIPHIILFVMVAFTPQKRDKKLYI